MEGRVFSNVNPLENDVSNVDASQCSLLTKPGLLSNCAGDVQFLCYSELAMSFVVMAIDLRVVHKLSRSAHDVQAVAQETFIYRLQQRNLRSLKGL